jgi:hypothetical protein
VVHPDCCPAAVLTQAESESRTVTQTEDTTTKRRHSAIVVNYTVHHSKTNDLVNIEVDSAVVVSDEKVDGASVAPA